MKKSLFALAAALLFAAGAFAQTQRLNRTNTRTHDRSDATGTDQKNTKKPDQMNHQTDVDRNNPNNNTNTATPNGTGTNNNTNNKGTTNTNGTSTNGTNTNGGTGTSGSNINTNNPR